MTQHLSEFKVNGKTDTSIKGLPRKEIEVLSPGDLLTLMHANRSFIVDRKELLVYDDFSQIPPVAMLWLTEIPFINTSPPQPQP